MAAMVDTRVRFSAEIAATAIAASPRRPSRLAAFRNRCRTARHLPVTAPVGAGVEDQVRTDPNEKCRCRPSRKGLADDHSGKDVVGDEHRPTLSDTTVGLGRALPHGGVRGDFKHRRRLVVRRATGRSESGRSPDHRLTGQSASVAPGRY